jgi:hypothetical protein
MTRVKSKNLLWLGVGVLVLLGGWYLWGPSGALISLNEGNFAQFTGQFDSAANDKRVLVLVSPT